VSRGRPGESPPSSDMRPQARSDIAESLVPKDAVLEIGSSSVGSGDSGADPEPSA
jgi:hypothetical protein